MDEKNIEKDDEKRAIAEASKANLLFCLLP